MVLSVFLDHTTETVFQRLGLPIHNKGALAGCEYYATVINGLRQKKSNLVSFHHNTTSVDGSPPAPPSVITPAQLARVAAGVNPLCSMSPKASLMADALVHELCMAVCEGVVQRSVHNHANDVVGCDVCNRASLTKVCQPTTERTGFPYPRERNIAPSSLVIANLSLC